MDEHERHQNAVVSLLADIRERLGQLVNAAEFREDSVADAGGAAAPGAGVVLATLPASRLPAGIYEVGTIAYTSGVNPGDLANIALKRGSQQITDLLSGNSTSAGVRKLIVSLDGQSDLSLVVLNAGTGNYMGEIVATRLSRRRPRL